MPTYDYKCNSCGEEIEIKKSVNDPSPTQCPVCFGHTLYRYFKKAPVFELKGDWFKNKGQY